MSRENERLKIQASFWNGLAIAAGAGGIILPLLQAYSNDQVWSAQVFPHFSRLAS
ncbi:fucose permease [Bradyrhizobium japonicum]